MKKFNVALLLSFSLTFSNVTLAASCIPPFVQLGNSYIFPPYGGGRVEKILDDCWILVSRTTGSLFINLRNVTAISVIPGFSK